MTGDVPVGAGVLREAAAGIRALAEAATPGPWGFTKIGRRPHPNYVTGGRDCLDGVATEWALTWGPTDAELIARFGNPVVALAFADAFDAGADNLDRRGVTARLNPAERALLAAARAFLGREVDQ